MEGSNLKPTQFWWHSVNLSWHVSIPALSKNSFHQTLNKAHYINKNLQHGMRVFQFSAAVTESPTVLCGHRVWLQLKQLWLALALRPGALSIHAHSWQNHYHSTKSKLPPTGNFQKDILLSSSVIHCAVCTYICKQHKDVKVFKHKQSLSCAFFYFHTS